MCFIKMWFLVFVFLVYFPFIQSCPVNHIILPGAEWSQIGKDIDGEFAGDFSGIVSMSSDGFTVAIGAIQNDANGEDSGHVRVFQWNGGNWTQVGADIDGEFAGDFSGFSLSLSSNGSVVAIGAPFNSPSVSLSAAGHVRVYNWDGTVWAQRGGDIDGQSLAESSHVVSLSSDGSIVAIGGEGYTPPQDESYNDLVTDSGFMRVFQWDGSDWSQLGETIRGTALGDKSGQVSLSSDGTVVAIGASGFMEDSGHVRMFQWGGSGWSQLGDSIDGDEVGDMSGSSVSLSSDGTIVAIGAPHSGNYSGHVRVFQWNGVVWSQIGNDIVGESNNDESGLVSLNSDGTIVAIGSGINDGNGQDSGHVRVFQWNGVVWTQIGSDIDGEAASDFSGFVSISSDGSKIAVGGVMNDGKNGEDSGHVRVYSVDCVQLCTECVADCPVGKYILESTTSCIACPHGTYGSEANATSCTACMVGRYQPLEGQTSLSACEFCPSGKYSNESGAIQPSVCKDCPVGFSNGFEHSNECYNCGGHHGDKYADETGLTECKDCPLGFFQEGYGATATECSTCSAGKYVTLVNSLTECVTCHHGQYQDEIGKYWCKQCSVDGTYAIGEGLTACLDCPTGYYSASWTFDDAYDQCRACGPGRFQNDVQGAWCVDCSSGTYTDENGQGECKTCADAGTYVTGLKQTSCADCPAGYDSSSEASSCTACSPGEYQTDANGAACQDCPAGYDSSSEASSCTACSSGEYQTDANGAACQDCPAGFDSSGAASSCGEINECDPSPCVNGDCNDLINEYKCACEPGYEGVNCSIDIDDCASSPCVNGGCDDLLNEYKCACEPGYEGVNCSIDIDDCASSPCVNGNCTDLVNDYNCICEPGYEGVNCETDIDDCANVTCIGKGTCIDEVNGYFCKPYKVTGDFNFYVLAVWVGIAAIVLICVGLKSTHDSVKEYVDAPSNPVKEKKQLYW